MGTTLADLHRIAAHVLGRRRFEVSGHFGLRASPGGLATPAFGPEPEVLRLAGASLVREIGADARSVPLEASTMAELAAFAGTDLAAAFSAGPDTPPVGPVDQPFHVSPSELDAFYDWFELGSRVLDQALCTRTRAGEQLDGAAVARALRRGDGGGAGAGTPESTSASPRATPFVPIPTSTSGRGAVSDPGPPVIGTLPSVPSCRAHKPPMPPPASNSCAAAWTRWCKG